MNERLNGSSLVAWVMTAVIAIATPIVLIGASIAHMGRANFGMDLAIWIAIVGGFLVIAAGIICTRLSHVRTQGNVTRIAWHTTLGAVGAAVLAVLVISIGLSLN